jgi:hypothetical protein
MGTYRRRLTHSRPKQVGFNSSFFVNTVPGLSRGVSVSDQRMIRDGRYLNLTIDK